MGKIPGWVRWANGISLVLYGFAIAAYLVFGWAFIDGLRELMPVILLRTNDPETARILLFVYVILIISASFIFSLLSHTSARTLFRAYREGGGAGLRGASLHIWIIAAVAQLISWAALVIMLRTVLSGIFQFDPLAVDDVKKLAEGFYAFQDGIIWIMLFPFATLFAPGCLRLAPLVFLFKQRSAASGA